MSFEITCPHCGRTFEEDETKFASIVQQVHDAEFERALAAQVKLVEDAHAAQQQAAVAKALSEASKASAQKDEQIAALKAELDAAEKTAKLASAQALSEQRAASEKALTEQQAASAKALSEQQAASAKALSEQREASARALSEQQAASARAIAAKEAELAELRARFEALQASAESSTELAVTKAVAQAQRANDDALRKIEHERDEAAHAAELARRDVEQAKAQAAEALASEKQRSAERIAERDEEIARYRDMRSRLNTKLIGESLEQHCEIEYEKLRPLFGSAEFHKDNESVEGTKGDYIFRDFSDEGAEYISIMFEMKTEEEGATHHKKNSDHLKKLDADRRKKNCEYAVLVSMLEPENELYNQGIVDMSHEYEKMYVIRPQFFIPIITLLRNAAQKQLGLRAELEQARAESIDITNFEEALNAFKVDFNGTTERASKKFAEAIANIDKAIADLEKVKAAFQLTEKHLNTANNKADRLTIRRLTREAPMLRERFAEISEQKAAAALPEGVSSAEVAEPDEVE